MPSSIPRIIAALLLVAGAFGSSAKAENWPGWRGPARTGVTGDMGVPTSWSATDNVLWKIPVPGTGTANPVVWEDRVFLTASDGRDQGELNVFCFDRDTGRTRWHRRLWGTAPTLFYPKSGMASPSPVSDGKHLWAAFGTGDIFCFDLDGNLVWQRALSDEYGVFENRFGAASSPLLFEDTLIHQCDHYGESYVVALDKATGANRWKADRPEVWLSWSSPQLVPIGNRAELVLTGSEKLDGYDPRTGKWLWTVRGLARECVPTPVLANGLLISVSGPNGTHFGVKPGGTGDVTTSHVAWRNERGTSFVPSGIAVGERYYVADDKGIATCLDSATGKLLWRKRLGGRFTASPVAADGRLFFTDEAGSTLVLDAAQPDYHELSRNDIGEDVYASPAISQGRLFLRTAKSLVCVGTK
ncbi:MAG: PQQ-binding-like beta-propeller repeat protein [Planctomycetia bacterium]|nr:PQQ-binding-like beta-propeller repeat protein [Planctomycetia bacterium]